MTQPVTMFEKIWRRHVVSENGDGATLLYIDRHLIHEGSFQAFDLLREKGLAVARPGQTLGAADHYVPTLGAGMGAIADADTRRIVAQFGANTREFGVPAFGIDDAQRGIVHVVGPEQGFTLPGSLMVCGDSHTSTHGALGALAFGIGASEVAHVLATQTLWQTRPRTMRISVHGRLPDGVAAKDLILFAIAQIGAGGAIGHVIEYAGEAIRALSIEQRLTVCNMSIEAGARAGMIAPDDRTFEYLRGRPMAPQGQAFEQAVAFWRTLPSDPGGVFDAEVTLDATRMAPMVTWGTSPMMASPVDGSVPGDADAAALDYMGLQPGTPIADITVDQVFIGSCTNSRIEDLRAAAAIARLGRAVIPAMVSPGSGLVKAQAEQEGLDRVFLEAGFEWRLPGCSMCVGMNGDLVASGTRCASTSNRNFRGRQGPGARTHLVSPATAAATALAGRFADARTLGSGVPG